MQNTGRRRTQNTQDSLNYFSALQRIMCYLQDDSCAIQRINAVADKL